jgi:hypothetical protein
MHLTGTREPIAVRDSTLNIVYIDISALCKLTEYFVTGLGPHF